MGFPCWLCLDQLEAHHGTLRWTVTELASRFNLGDKAGPLLSGLLGLIADNDKGGLTGFLDRLRRGGLSDQVASWVGSGTNANVEPGQLEPALGRDTVERVSASAGVPASTGGSALAFALPKIVDLLTGQADIPAESRDIIDQSAKAIQGAPEGSVLQVSGHTDNRGSAAGNQAPSARRAAAVRDYLVQRGVEPSALTAKGFGAGQPAADNGTEAGRFKNRRIEFTVVK